MKILNRIGRMNGLMDDLALSDIEMICLCRHIYLTQGSREMHALHNSKLIGFKIDLALVCISGGCIKPSLGRIIVL